MADEPTLIVTDTPVPKVIPKRTSDRAEALADGLLDILLERIQNKTATASEIKEAREYIKEAGIRLIVSEGSKAGELVRALPRFDDDGKILGLPEGVSVRRAG